MTSATIDKRGFFISRAGQDNNVALAIARIVRDAGCTTWLQDEDFGHASFMAQIEHGLDSGGRVIALLSTSYQRSDYCRKEYNVALTGDPLNLKQRLIVLRVKDCQPSGNLTDIAFTDLLPVLAIPDDRQREEHLRRVVRVLIGAEASQVEIDFASLYRRAPQQILHAQIDAVAGFTGRETELETLERTLWTKGGTAALTNSGSASAAVRGLGGVGKSVLAREYAWRRRELYHGVWWVRAEARETLLDDLIDLGARLGIPGIKEVPEREQAARLALDTLSQAGFEKPWLIVYDNVEEPRHIDKLTPRLGAHVLITTRWSDWYGHAAELPVDVFTPDVAVEYLMARARMSEREPGGTQAAAGGLAADLGYLPLALSHARSYCWVMNWGFDQYRKRLPELIKKAPRNAAYPATVFATFDLAIETAARVCPEAEKLIAIVAFLAPDRIHRLVQEVTRGRLQSGEQSPIVALATELLADACPSGDKGPYHPSSWPTFGKLLPHALAVLQYAPETGDTAEATDRLLCQTALYLNARADFAAAEPMMRRAIGINEANQGSQSSRLSTYLQNLAGLLWDTGRYQEAVPLMLRAIAIDEARRGSDHPDVASGINTLASLHQSQGNFATAEPLFRRALAINEKALGPEHPSVAQSLNNLAGLQHAQARYDEARPLFERSLAIMEKVLGPEHPDVARGLNNLAALQDAQGRYDEARPLYERSLAIHEKALGPEHPNVAMSLNNLALLHRAQGRYDEARPLLERSLAIYEKALGSEHPTTSLIRSNLARAEPSLDELLRDLQALQSSEQPATQEKSPTEETSKPVVTTSDRRAPETPPRKMGWRLLAWLAGSRR